MSEYSCKEKSHSFIRSCKGCGFDTGSLMYDTCASCAVKGIHDRYRMQKVDFFDSKMVSLFTFWFNLFENKFVETNDFPIPDSSFENGFHRTNGVIVKKTWRNLVFLAIIESLWGGPGATALEGHGYFLVIKNRILVHWYKNENNKLRFFKYNNHEVDLDKLEWNKRLTL